MANMKLVIVGLAVVVTLAQVRTESKVGPDGQGFEGHPNSCPKPTMEMLTAIGIDIATVASVVKLWDGFTFNESCADILVKQNAIMEAYIAAKVKNLTPAAKSVYDGIQAIKMSSATVAEKNAKIEALVNPSRPEIIKELRAAGLGYSHHSRGDNGDISGKEENGTKEHSSTTLAAAKA